MIDGSVHMLATTIDWGAWGSPAETTVDLLAATTNALNGALLARRPDHYRTFTNMGRPTVFRASSGKNRIYDHVRDAVVAATAPTAMNKPEDLGP